MSMNLIWMIAVVLVGIALIVGIIVWQATAHAATVATQDDALDLTFHEEEPRGGGTGGDTVTTKGEGDTATSKGKRGRVLAVVVGVNQYRSKPSSNLNQCVNDARAVRELLLREYGATPRNVKLLCDLNATTRNIKTALTNAVRAARTGDRIFFWFSGHGSQLPCTVEADGQMEILCPTDLHDDWDNNNVSDDFIAERAAEAARKGVAFYMGADACHSGDITKTLAAGAAKYLPPPPSVRFNRSTPTRAAKAAQANVVVLTGCTSDEASYEYADKRHGALTYAFLEAAQLHGAFASAEELHESIYATVQAAFPQQHPQLEGSPRLAALPFLSPMPSSLPSSLPT
jgi:uncharacterized caspase-like protein